MGLPQTEKGYLAALENVMRTNDKTNSKNVGRNGKWPEKQGVSAKREPQLQMQQSLESPKRNLKKPEVVLCPFKFLCRHSSSALVGSCDDFAHGKGHGHRAEEGCSYQHGVLQ
jgi:hypothetical protein